MGIVTIQEYTPIKPINMIGLEAGVCWGADITDEEKNRRRGLECLQSGHMRAAEFPQVYMILDGYSARVIREFYTHIAGGPTRLQASTRYIDYSKDDGFDYIIPSSVKETDETFEQYLIYKYCMDRINKYCQLLTTKYGVSKEDAANLLPLGMETKVVVRTNLRHLIDMSHQRLCNRAYWEFRQLMKDIMEALSEYSPQWEYLVKNYFKPKCEVCGFCTEKNTCGRRPKEDEVKEYIEIGKKWKNLSKEYLDDLITLLPENKKEELIRALVEKIKKL
jgi:thymidylate synthase (FAD)